MPPTSAPTAAAASDEVTREAKLAHMAEPTVIAERGCYFISGQLVRTDAGTRMKGQTFVQYEFPVEVKHPFPVVMVHGGGGQGLDFLTTADGREGWATHFLRAGYRVYVIDRQGHGRAFYDPDLLGAMGRPPSLEQIPSLFSGNTDSPGNPFAHLHTQWPGSGDADDPATLNFFASQGRPIADVAESHHLMRQSGVQLLEKIGPSILITNSAGGAWGWQAADAVPLLVKGIVCIEGARLWSTRLREPSAKAELYAFTAAPMAFEPPIESLADITLQLITPEAAGESPYLCQVGPPRRLANLTRIPVGYVSGEASLFRGAAEGVLANMRQLDMDVHDLCLWKHGIHGNGHVPMVERNSSEVASFVIDWLTQCVET
jgi:pimeloyl-ACP methyl ester carboxylesterase